MASHLFGWLKEADIVQVQVFLSDELAPSIVMDGQEFTVNNRLWDKNFDDTAFEVVNERGDVVFQFLYLTNAIVSIKGVFTGGGYTFFAYDEGFAIPPAGSSPPPDFHISKLFRYPALINHGRRISSSN